jgi:phosphoesterase RecJ-like protein
VNIPISEIEKLKKAIETADFIVLTGHQNPDADCVGANLGLFHVLKEQRKQVQIILPNRFPDNLKWMPSTDQIVVYEKDTELASQYIQKADLIFSIDYNHFSRTGKMQNALEQAKAQKVIIDHHPEPDIYHITFSDTSVSSASELVYEVIKHLHSESIVNIQSAECLFAGIMADTGCFSYNSSKPKTFLNVAELLEKQINKDYIKAKLFDNYSIERTRLMGYLLSEKMVVLPEFRTAYIVLSEQEKEKFGYKIGDSEGFVNLPLSIENINFSVFIMEHEGFMKMSMRSRGNFDVNQFARKHFKGGGHKNAAGGKDFDLKLLEVADKLVSLLPQYKEELLNS